MLSDDDREMDLDSDDDDFGLGDDDGLGLGDKGVGGNGANCKPMSQAEKRAHHNMLERKRRDHIKDSFVSLRDSVPALQGEKTKQSSRAQILKKAAEYIQFMRRKNSAHQHDIEDLKRQNHILENQIRALERARLAGGSRDGTCNDMLDGSADMSRTSLMNSRGHGGGGSDSEENENSEDDGEMRNMSSPESPLSSSNTSSTMSNGTKKITKVITVMK